MPNEITEGAGSEYIARESQPVAVVGREAETDDDVRAICPPCEQPSLRRRTRHLAERIPADRVPKRCSQPDSTELAALNSLGDFRQQGPYAREFRVREDGHQRPRGGAQRQLDPSGCAVWGDGPYIVHLSVSLHWEWP
ncbi:hypothetical protein [Krasilnikovia sp. MM14-A1004]|uniref:hypothetical protein n=1 Tax=Krasilnikovia sp. MM14-A1004 TaxID=3373541 RepID=UPI00399C525F